MNDVDKALDNELDKLYQEHKAQTQVPRRVKKRVMEKAVLDSEASKNRWSSTHWVSAAASITVFAVLINMFVVQKDTLDSFDEVALQPQQKNFVVGIVHRLESEEPGLTAKEMREQKLEKIYDDYQRQKLAFAVHRQQAAQLIAVSDGWALQTCDEEIVKISSKLVDLFVDWDRIEADIALGDQVDIAFDEEGRIAKITRIDEAEAMRCT